MLFAKESHSEDRLDMNSSTKAWSLLLMSTIGGRSNALSDVDILDDFVVCVLPRSVLSLVTFSFSCHTYVHHGALVFVFMLDKSD